MAGWPARPTRPPLPLALAHTGELSTAPPLEMGRSVTPLCSLLLHLQDPRGSNHISGQPYKKKTETLNPKPDPPTQDPHLRPSAAARLRPRLARHRGGRRARAVPVPRLFGRGGRARLCAGPRPGARGGSQGRLGHLQPGIEEPLRVSPAAAAAAAAAAGRVEGLGHVGGLRAADGAAGGGRAGRGPAAPAALVWGAQQAAHMQAEGLGLRF